MTRKRDPLEVRDDALWMGAHKLGGGCIECAEGYFTLARQNGATEQDIQMARLGGSDYSRLTRRAVLKTAAAAATGFAASVAAGSLLPAAARAAITSAGPSARQPELTAAKAWIIGSTPTNPQADTLHMTSAAGGHSLAGLASNASINSVIEGVSTQIFRSSSGGEFYLPWSYWDATTSTSRVETYDAASGSHERTLVGAPIERGAATDIWEGLWPTLSADGRLLALLRRTHRTYGRYGSDKNSGAVPRQELILGAEIFDMVKGTSSYLELNRDDDRVVANSIAESSLDGSHVYIFVRKYAGRLKDSLIVLDVDGTHASIKTHFSDGEGGHAIPFLSMPDDMNPVRITADSRYLVFFSLPLVIWFDLVELTVAHTLTLPFSVAGDARMPPRPYGRFSPDVSMLYLATPETGDLLSVELRARRVSRRAALPKVTFSGTANDETDEYSLGSQSVAISTDGTELYVADGRGGSGFWVLRLPDFKVQAHLLTGHDVRALWAAADGTIYALGERYTYSITRGGSLLGVGEAGNAYAFSIPTTTSPAMW